MRHFRRVTRRVTVTFGVTPVVPSTVLLAICMVILAMQQAQQPTKPTAPHSQGVTPSESEQQGVKALMLADGERAACRKLGIDRTTAARVAAGLPVRRGTLALVRESLAALGSGAR